MKKCIICGYSYDKKHGVSLHEIPSGPIRDKWFEVINRPNVQAMSTVCGHHFRNEDYRDTPHRKFLLPGAVPSLHLDTSYLLPVTSSRARTLCKSSYLQTTSSAPRAYCMPALKYYAAVECVTSEIPPLTPLIPPHDSSTLSPTSGTLSIPPPLIAVNEQPCHSAPKKVLREIQINPADNVLFNEHSYSIQRSNENGLNYSVGTQTDLSNFQNMSTLQQLCESQKIEKCKLKRAFIALEQNLKTWTEKSRKLRAERKKLIRSQYKFKQLNDRLGALKLELKKIVEDPYHKAVFKLKEDAIDVSNIRANFLLEQIKFYNGKKPHYSEETLREASIWFHKGPSAYEYARKKKLLTLPSGSTLKRFLGPVSNITGLSELLEEKLKAQLKKLKASDQHVSLFIDEMEATNPFFTNIQVDMQAGSEPVPENAIKASCAEREEDNLDEDLMELQESEALTDQSSRKRMVAFVLVGLTVTFQIPCAYYFCNDVNAFDLHNMVQSVVRNVEELGYTVFRVVANRRALTSSMFQFLGDGTLPAVKHPVDSARKLFVSFDDSEIVKHLRNNLMHQAMSGCSEQTKEAVMKMQESIEQMETMNPAQYFICRHMQRKEVKSTNVNRSVQVFSGPVVTALENLKNFSVVEHSATVKFLEMLQKWQAIHNILNGQHNYKNLEQIMFVTASDERLKWLQQTFPHYLNSIRKGQNYKAKEVLTCEIYEALLLSSTAAVQSIEYLIKVFKTFPPLSGGRNSTFSKEEFEIGVSPTGQLNSFGLKHLSTDNVSLKRAHLPFITMHGDEPQSKKESFIIHQKNAREVGNSLHTYQTQTVAGCEEVIHSSQNAELGKVALNTVEPELESSNVRSAESLQSSVLFSPLVEASDSQQRISPSECTSLNELSISNIKVLSPVKSSDNNLVILHRKKDTAVWKGPGARGDNSASERNLKQGTVLKQSLEVQGAVKHGLVRVGQSKRMRTPCSFGPLKSPQNETLTTTFHLGSHKTRQALECRLPQKAVDEKVIMSFGRKVLVLKKEQNGKELK